MVASSQMSNMQNRLEQTSPWTAEAMPEVRLLAAILTRALLDLYTPDTREDAIEWFRNGETVKGHASLAWVCDNLNIDQSELTKITEMIITAIQGTTNIGSAINKTPAVYRRFFSLSHTSLESETKRACRRRLENMQ